MLKIKKRWREKKTFMYISLKFSIVHIVFLDAQIAYEEAMATLFLPESGNILAKTIQVPSKTIQVPF